ncbi:alpha/beta-hydrolase [Setomelanomma holmii]|uniref:Alpha/beta-hydrolase n=1 Tax=Setomelanomma holmii TaxID=210430 RepID=A0A9P4LGB0_9PLEO|nr:alpha/beta-hydrolase [Setomelanomma holmii]
MQENESMKLADGRTLSYAIYGSPVPRITALYFHGFPSSRYEGKLLHSAATKHGIRIIAPDRPGAGLSSFQANRELLDWPVDVLALADQLKVSEFYVLGVSGGGPYALACVKTIPRERLLGATVVSGLYPVKYGTAGMMTISRLLFWVAPWLTGLTSFIFDNAIGKAARNDDPKVLEDLMSKDIDTRYPKDVAVIKDPSVWPVFVAMTRESFVKGGQGAAWEARMFGSPWGFELSELDVGDNGTALSLWHGTEDANCPVSMPKKAKDEMPDSILYLREGEGHTSYVFRDVEQILNNLVGRRETEEYVKVGA